MKSQRAREATMTKIEHLGTEKDGIITVDVTINGKPYTYYLDSEYAYGGFLTNYHNGYHGRAIAWLNKFKIERRR